MSTSAVSFTERSGWGQLLPPAAGLDDKQLCHWAILLMPAGLLAGLDTLSRWLPVSPLAHARCVQLSDSR
jgi:hypothetical protein